MRTLIVLCYVAAACAQYEYQLTSQSGEAVLSNGIPDGGFNGLTLVDTDPLFAPQGDISVAANDAPLLAPQSAIDTEFYTFSANDNDFDDNGAQQVINSSKQNFRVVFIKGPENRGLENAALTLAKQAGQQQTAIYVLNKQADIADLANKLNNINQSVNNKPDVHFVKYRTPEDAVNAQRAIQGQYDSLGGNTKTINGGAAPVLNFASSAPETFSHHSAEVLDAPTNSYIPPGAFANAGPTNSYIPPGASAAAGPTNSYIPPAASDAPAPTNSYIPPDASVAAGPTNSYIPPAASGAPAPTNSYIPPTASAAAGPTNSYIPPAASSAAAPTNSYIPPTASSAAAPTNSYIPPAASVAAAPINSYTPSAPAAASTNSYIPPAPVSGPTNSYIPPVNTVDAPTNSYSAPAHAAEAPTNSYIPPAPVAAELSASYLPASVLRLFRL